MADAMDTLKSILGNDAEDKIKGVMNSLGTLNESDSVDTDEGRDYLAEMKDIINRLGSSRSDPRANLLLSLKPYMRKNRQRTIDGAVRLLNLSKLSGLLKDI
jgi:hypothetical protein